MTGVFRVRTSVFLGLGRVFFRVRASVLRVSTGVFSLKTSVLG